MDMLRIEKALTYALASSLGHLLRPKFHKGIANKGDLEALDTLIALREELGIRNVSIPVAVAEPKALEDL